MSLRPAFIALAYRVPAYEAPFYMEFQVERPVRVTHYEPPTYPANLKSRGVQGEVLVSFVVDTTGVADMRTYRVVRAVDFGFLPAIRQTVSAMRFEPARLGGRKVRQKVQQPFSFYISGAAWPDP